MKMERGITLYLNYCRSKQLRPRTIGSYEQALRLFARWLREAEGIENVEKVTDRREEAFAEIQARGDGKEDDKRPQKQILMRTPSDDLIIIRLQHHDRQGVIRIVWRKSQRMCKSDIGDVVRTEGFQTAVHIRCGQNPAWSPIVTIRAAAAEGSSRIQMLADPRDDKACQIRNLGGLRMISHEVILADLIAAKTVESSV